MHPARERGFVLIGVIIMVLALTILGLSLFSLSSYEAQFVGQRLSAGQALYDAESGMEMVKAVLTTSSSPRLDMADQVVGHYGVVNAVALQNTGNPFSPIDSAGPVRWDSTVTIRVLTRQGTMSRVVEAKFRPSTTQNFFKRLFTTYASVEVKTLAVVGPPDRCGTTRFRGSVWQGVGSDTSWAGSGCTTWLGPRPVVLDTIPLPDVGTFLTAHLPAADTVTIVPDGGEDDVFLDGSTSGRFFKGPITGAGTHFTYENTANRGLEIRVRRRCVWLLERGMRVDGKLQVRNSGFGDATLVLVAPPNGSYPFDPTAGLYFFGGLEVESDVTLILVSSGKVWIEANNGYPDDSEARNLSVYAASISVLGPQPGRWMDLRYDSDMSDEIDELLERGLLPAPQAGGSTGTFTLVPGSWHEPTP